MFRRGEQLESPVALTDQDTELLHQEVLLRIVVDENGVEYLDGFQLPPDNEEVWNPRVIRGQVMREETVREPETGAQTQESTTTDISFESRLTNSFVRHINIRSISLGHQPLFITWEEASQDASLAKEERAELERLRTKEARERVGRGMRLDEMLGPDEAMRVAKELGSPPQFQRTRRRNRTRLA